jgi:hypothetical protein
MALSTTTSSITYVGNGVTTSFAYPFRILDAAHLGVRIGGVVQTAGYAVTGVDVSTGGFVNFSVAPANNATVVLERVVPLTQPVDTVNNETILEEVIDKSLDRATMQIQQVDRKAGRAFRLAESDNYAGSLILPDTEARKGKFFYFDEASGAPFMATLSTPVLINNVAPNLRTFSGDGTTAVFNLTGLVPSAALTWVFISGVYQQKATYSINGTTLTFSVAPPAGANNIEVVTLPSYAVAGGVAAAGIVDSTAIGRALLMAATMAAARDAIGLGTGDTAQFNRVEAGDTHFNSRLVGGDPRTNFDVNDYINFKRATHLWTLVINNVNRLEIDETTFTVPNGLLIDGSNLQMDSGYGSLAPAYGVRAWWNFSGVPLSGTYSRAGSLINVTMTAHGMTTGQIANLDFTTGTATDGNYVVTVTGANTFTVNDTVSGATSGNVTRNTWLRGGGNVLGVLDDGVGMYRVLYASNMPDVNYAVNVSANGDNADAPPLVGNTWVRSFYTNPSVGSVSIGTIDATGAAFVDSPGVSGCIIR